MIPISKVKSGISRFVEQEICSQIIGWKKFVVATAVGLLMSKFETAASSLPLGLVQGEMMDVETIYKEAITHMDAPVPVDVPGVGTFSFTKENLATLYRMIVG